MALQAPVKLPYFRAAAELLGPLPTPEEICDTSKPGLSPRRSAWGDSGGMCLIRGIYVLKFGANVTENEGNALLFVEKHLDISAPRLYAMYRDPPSGPLHLVMEYIRGVDLESLWNSLSVEAKLSITTQLQPMLAQMHSLSPPRDFISGVCGGSIPDPVFMADRSNTSINGPFRTAEEVGSALALTSRSNWEQTGRRGWISNFFSRHLAAALKDHGINFTHGDLHMRNILVENVLTEPSLESAGAKAAEANQRWSYQVSPSGCWWNAQ